MKGTRRSMVLVAVATAAVAVLALADDADAGRRRARTPKPKKRLPVAVTIETPLGLQGLESSGTNLVIPFELHDPSGVPADIEAQYGVDRNLDGLIASDEYTDATEDRLDARDTRSNRRPRLFVTAGGLGAAHAFVWRTAADLGSERHLIQLYQFTAQGRLNPDPAHRGEFLFDDALGGVRFRIRAVRKEGGRRRVGRWAFTESFEVDNNARPGVTIDGVSRAPGGAAPDDRLEIRWTAIDRDSEDTNGNGLFDPGEDVNGNRVFDQSQVGVAFDWYQQRPGEDIARLSPIELEQLAWRPCKRVPDAGDTDSFRESDPAAAVYGAPAGRQWRFVWDAKSDAVSLRVPIVLRARVIDHMKAHSEFDYELQMTVRESE